ncbi:MAG: YbaN family protein [Clostridium sp.]|uniref:YbaN family protein n=1 Tax=Clostridium sp. TaxID=1506 RepID=UPI003D6C71C4
MNKIIKIIYVLVGFISLGLGIIGIILPVLPTTPFLLLASVCFMRGSEKLNNWFKSTKIYKKHLESFIKDRALTLKQKILILFLADFMIAFPLIIANNILMKTVLIFIILCKYYYFIFKIKTRKILKVDYETEEN